MREFSNLPCWGRLCTHAVVVVAVYVAAVLVLPHVTELSQTWNAERQKLAEENDAYVLEHGGWDRHQRRWNSAPITLADN